MNEIVTMLAAMPVFEEVPQDQLEWLAEHGSCQRFAPGQDIFTPGTPMENMLVMLQGRAVIRIEQKGQFRELGELKGGDLNGTLPFSRAKETRARCTVVDEVHLMTVPKSCFKELTQRHYELTATLVQHMISRVRTFTTLGAQNEKMMSLGKISAGLAHELNNPASAVARGSQELKKHLLQTPERYKKVTLSRMTPEQVDVVNEILFSRAKAGVGHWMSMMEKAELEDTLADFLEDNGIDDGYEYAGTMADFGFSEEDLETVLEAVPDSFATVVPWMDNVLTTEKLVTEIEEASQRIERLVKSIKSYSHMDQAPEKQPVDLHEGLKNTLTMLGHKIRQGNVKVTENFDKALPPAKVLVGELNQVWTNLIDNAVDALKEVESPSLEISTRKDREFALIDIVDNGPGIPEDIKTRVFDPFFTTKAVGEGTGLGLDVVRRIVDRQHNGRIYLESEPGRTKFTVCIPLE